MKPYVFSVTVTLVVLLSSCALQNNISTTQTASPHFIEKPDDKVNKALMLQLINEVRKKGCICGNQYFSPAPSLLWNNQLEQAALAHSTDMFTKNYFSHMESDGT